MNWRQAREGVVQSDLSLLRQLFFAVPCNRRHGSGRQIDPSNAVVTDIGHEQTPTAVQHNAVRILEHRLGCWSAVASVSLPADYFKGGPWFQAGEGARAFNGKTAGVHRVPADNILGGMSDIVEVLLISKKDNPHGHGAVKELMGVDGNRISPFDTLKKMAVFLHQKSCPTPTGVNVKMGSRLTGYALKLI